MASSNQQSLPFRTRLSRPPLDITYSLVHQYVKKKAPRNLRNLRKAQKEAPTEAPEEAPKEATKEAPEEDPHEDPEEASEEDSEEAPEEDPEEDPEEAPEEDPKKDPKKGPKEILEKRPEDSSDSYDHVRITYNSNSYLNARLPSDPDLFICCVHFSWTNYSGDMSGAYDMIEDTLISHKLLPETLRRYAGANKTISDAKITLFKERTRDGTLVVNGGRYIRLDVRFIGRSVPNAKIWGKRVTGGVIPGAMQLSREERLRLGIEGYQWKWIPD